MHTLKIHLHDYNSFTILEMFDCMYDTEGNKDHINIMDNFFIVKNPLEAKERIIIVYKFKNCFSKRNLHL